MYDIGFVIWVNGSQNADVVIITYSHVIHRNVQHGNLNFLYDKLATCVHFFLHKTLKLYLGFPKRLLHLSTHLGDFGIPDLCAYAQKTKYSIICRHLRADQAVQHSVDSLFTRAHSIYGAAIQSGAPVLIPFPSPSQIQISSSLWTTSLLQFL